MALTFEVNYCEGLSKNNFKKVNGLNISKKMGAVRVDKKARPGYMLSTKLHWILMEENGCKGTETRGKGETLEKTTCSIRTVCPVLRMVAAKQ